MYKLNQKRLSECAGTDFLVFHKDETASTNSDAKQFAMDCFSTPMLFTCDSQTSGRGRNGHSWTDCNGTICMSLLLKNDVAPQFSQRYVIAVAVAVQTVLASYADGIKVKWPNDIMFGGKKLCGILLESVGRSIVIGIGLNMTNESFPPDIEALAVSMKMMTKKNLPVENIVVAIMRRVLSYSKLIATDKGFDELLDVYRQASCTLGQNVVILGIDGKRAHGLVVDFDRYGRILLEDGQGNITPIDCGDVSLRGKDA